MEQMNQVKFNAQFEPKNSIPTQKILENQPLNSQRKQKTSGKTKIEIQDILAQS